MKKEPIYCDAKYYEDEHVAYGSQVTAYFYADDKIAER